MIGRRGTMIGRLAEHPIGAVWSYPTHFIPHFLSSSLFPFRQFQKHLAQTQTTSRQGQRGSARMRVSTNGTSCISRREGQDTTTYVAEKSHDARLLPLHDHPVSNGDCVSFSFLLFPRARMQPVDRLSRYGPITSHTHLSLSQFNYFEFLLQDASQRPFVWQTRLSKGVSLTVSTSAINRKQKR